MSWHDFIKKYPSLVGELEDYQGAKPGDDEKIAARWLREPFPNGLESQLATAVAVVAQAKALLKDFARDGGAFAEATNRHSLKDPAHARAWLEKMLLLWEHAARRLEEMKRAG
jgi:hypothetical protein